MKKNILEKNGLPVLDSYVKDVGVEHFAGTHILYINHVISDAVMTALALKESGADLTIVGIPYGSLESPEREWVVQTYKDIGETFIPEIPSSVDFKEKMDSSVQDALESLKGSNKDILIVEDGGYAFPMMHDRDSYHGILDRTLGAVEHTSRGMWNYQYREIDETPVTPREISKPAITIANSKLKSCHEPIFVAQGVVHELVAVLTKQHEFLPFKNVVVLGHGKIGKPIARLISNIGSSVEIVDPKSTHQSIHSEVTQKVFSASDYFIGASGTPVFGLEQIFELLKSDTRKNHKMFVSASSKNIEFYNLYVALEALYIDTNLAQEILGEDARVHKQAVPEFGTTYTITIRNKDRKYTIIGEGYPIIFFPKNTHGAPNKPFDPVMTQLFVAAATMREKHSSLENRVYTLDEIQNRERDSWNELIKDRKILVRWCMANNIDPEWYLQTIGYE